MTTQLTEAGQKLADALVKAGVISELRLTNPFWIDTLNTAAQILMTPEGGGGLREALIAEALEKYQKIDGYHKEPIIEILEAFGAVLLGLSPPTGSAGDDETGVREDEVAGLIRSHVRLEWHGHDHADINPRSVTAAARAIVASLAPQTGSAGAAPKTPDAATGGSVGGYDSKAVSAAFERALPGAVERLGQIAALAQTAPVGEDETGVRERYAAAICDGFTNGNVEYANEPDNRKLSYQMAADAVLALAPQPPKAETPAGVGEDRVPMPTNADQAVLMWLLGEQWVRENAPDRLRPDAALSHAPAARAGDDVRDAAQFVHDTFARDLAQGYQTKDKDFAVSILGSALAQTARAGDGVERVRHLKRGTEYEVLGEAEAQIAVGDGFTVNSRILREGSRLTVYRGCDGKLWCRFTDEFRDGRFVTLTAAPAANGEGA